MKEIESTQYLEYENIEDLAEQVVEGFITTCEHAYGKDDMTEGEIPMAALFKGMMMLMNIKSINQNLSEEICKELVIDNYEIYKNLFKNYK